MEAQFSRTQVPMSRMEVQDQGAAGWVSGENPLPHRWPSCHCNYTAGGARGFLKPLLIGALKPLMAPLSMYHLPKAPPPSHHLGVKISK